MCYNCSGSSQGTQNATGLAPCGTTPALIQVSLGWCIAGSRSGCGLPGAEGCRLRASGAQAGGAFMLLLPGVRANTHHSSSPLSISPWAGTVVVA